ncbi:MAG: MFS transporter [Chloroflexi bacterium]|nr:MFS transporter [Chloroflexota bacterium]MDA1227204.1 MFS transporter [Chloroflexota bacterium]
MAAAVTIGSSQYIFGLYFEPLEDAFGWNRTQISASLSFSAIGSLAAPLLGRLMDRYGTRYVMSLSLVLTAVSFLLRPLMSELWHWYGLSLIQFIGFSGAVMLPAGKLVGIWFQGKRGRVMGVAMMGNNFGGLLMPAIAGFTLTAFSWRASYFVVGLTILLVGFAALALVHENVPAEGPRLRQSNPRPITGSTLKEALRSRVFYVLVALFIVGSMPFAALLPQMVAHLTNEGYTLASASMALSLIAVGGMAGKLVFGILAEHITAQKGMLISFSGLTVAIILMRDLPAYHLIWLVAPIFGLCMGSFGTLVTLATQDNFGLRSFGSITGALNAATVFAFALGPLLGGASFDVTGSYGTAFIAVAAMIAFGLLMVTQVRDGPFQSQP